VLPDIKSCVLYSIADERPCMNLSTMLDVSKLLMKAKTAGLQAIPGTSNLTYITNWDITSSIFLAFQVIGSVGKSLDRSIDESAIPTKINKMRVFRFLWRNLAILSAVTISALVVNQYQ